MAIQPGRGADPRADLVGRFLDAQRSLAVALTRLHETYDLPGSDFSCLLVLSRADGHHLRMNELAARTGMSTSGVTTVVERLLRAGLTTRTPDAHDRRALVVQLTEEGRSCADAALDDLVPVVLDHLGALAECRGAAERCRAQAPDQPAARRAAIPSGVRPIDSST